MSFFYKSNNDEKTQEFYLKNLIYKGEIAEPEYDNLIDFYDAERYLYGRVDYNYVPIIYNQAATSLATLTSTNTEQNNLQVLSFVARAFNDLNNQFKTKLLTGQISGADEFLSKLEVKKAYQNPTNLYIQYLAEIRDAIIETIQEEHLRFSNMHEFKKIFIELVTRISKQMPVTFPAFVKSYHCPMNVSGLVIEIADIDYANDEEKIMKFKQSVNWKFYLNACRSYGFWVDASNPFRLVANIGSEEMIEYARTDSQCSFYSTNSVLVGAYRKAFMGYENTLRAFLYQTYSLAKASYLNVEHCLDGTTITTVVEPIEHNESEMSELFDDLQFLMLYMELRINEGSVKFKEFEKNKLFKDTIKRYKKLGLVSAMAYFSKFINNTFNYNGSLTDLLNRDILIIQEELDVLSDT